MLSPIPGVNFSSLGTEQQEPFPVGNIRVTDRQLCYYTNNSPEKYISSSHNYRFLVNICLKRNSTAFSQQFFFSMLTCKTLKFNKKRKNKFSVKPVKHTKKTLRSCTASFKATQCRSQTQLTQSPFFHAAVPCEGVQELPPPAHIPSLTTSVTSAHFTKMHLQGERQVDGTCIGTSVFPQNLAKERWLKFVCDINTILLQIKFLLL